MDNRKNAREIAFKLVFEYLFSGDKNTASMQELFEESKLVKEQDYVSKVYYGIIDKFEELNNFIANNAIGFADNRIYKIDKAILLVALYEMDYMEDIPKKVSINEALELAKKYSTEKSPSFINGILSKKV